MYPFNPRQVTTKTRLRKNLPILPHLSAGSAHDQQSIHYFNHKDPKRPQRFLQQCRPPIPTHVRPSNSAAAQRLPRHTTGSSHAPFCRSSCPTTTPRVDDTTSGLHPCCTTSESAARLPTWFDRCSLIRSNAKATYGRPTLVSWEEMWLLHGSCTWTGRGSGIGGLRKRW